MRCLICSILILFGFNVSAQNEFLYNFNKEMYSLVNPSAINDFTHIKFQLFNKTIFITDRIKPNIQVASFTLPINNKNVALTFNAIHNQSGKYFTHNYFQTNFAYKIKWGSYYFDNNDEYTPNSIVFGLSGKIGQFTANYRDVILINKEDELFPTSTQNSLGYNYAAGITFNGKKSLRLGLGFNGFVGDKTIILKNQNAYDEAMFLNFSILSKGVSWFNIHSRVFSDFRTIDNFNMLIEPSLNLFNADKFLVNFDLGARLNLYNKSVPIMSLNSVYFNLALNIGKKIKFGVSSGISEMEKAIGSGNSEQLFSYTLKTKEDRLEAKRVKHVEKQRQKQLKRDADSNKRQADVFQKRLKEQEEAQRKKKAQEEAKKLEEANKYHENNDEIVNITDFQDIEGTYWSQTNSTIQRLENGDPIKIVTNIEEWNEYADQGKPAACYVDFNKNNDSKGLIYNRFVTEKGLNLPKGYKISAKEDWEKLKNHNNINLIINKLYGYLMVYKSKTIFYGSEDYICFALYNNDNEYVKVYNSSLEFISYQKEFNNEKIERIGVFIRLIKVSN